MQFPSTVLALLAAAAHVSAGINCRGSTNCGFHSGVLANLDGTVKSFPGGNTYSPGQHIACDKDSASNAGICVFTQGKNVGTISASRAAELLDALEQHGCKNCGSVPIAWPVNDDNAQGILTVNYVGKV